MLTVFSADNSSESSLAPIWLAADWASKDREVLIVEANPAGGSISEVLGIPVNPGSASLIASGVPAQRDHLIEHSLDVISENLHVMPAPTTPEGARNVVASLEERAEELRQVSDKEMAVIVIGGQANEHILRRDLLSNAAGFALVSTPQTDMTDLELYLREFASLPYGSEPKGFAFSVGPSQWQTSDWHTKCGLMFAGAVENSALVVQDYSVFTGKRKRKARRFLDSLEAVGELLYAYAHPPILIQQRELAEAEQKAQAQQMAEAAHETEAENAHGDLEHELEHELEHAGHTPSPAAQETGSFRDWAASLHGVKQSDTGTASA